MDEFLFNAEHPLLIAANDAFDREFVHGDALTDEDARLLGAEVAE